MEKEDFVSYDQAKILKRAGYDGLTCHYYDVDTEEFKPSISPHHTICYDTYNDYENFIAAPTIHQVQKWLREKEIFIFVYRAVPPLGYYFYIIKTNDGIPIADGNEGYRASTYEQALSDSINKGLKILNDEHYKQLCNIQSSSNP